MFSAIQLSPAEGRGSRKKGRGKGRGKEGKEGGAHTNSTRFHVSIAFSSFSGPGVRYVGDNCTQVVMATAEPHTLTLNRTRSTPLLGGAREGERRKEEEVWMKM